MKKERERKKVSIAPGRLHFLINLRRPCKWPADFYVLQPMISIRAKNRLSFHPLHSSLPGDIYKKKKKGRSSGGDGNRKKHERVAGRLRAPSSGSSLEQSVELEEEEGEGGGPGINDAGGNLIDTPKSFCADDDDAP